MSVLLEKKALPRTENLFEPLLFEEAVIVLFQPLLFEEANALIKQ